MDQQEFKSHQQLGQDLQLFFFDETSPGSCFFLPNGTIIFNRLAKYIRSLYRKYDYSEIKTPILCHQSLMERSGHWEKYKENMFLLQKERYGVEQAEKQEDEKVYILSCMNCPKSCLVFEHMHPSYKQMPIRLADCGSLHRNEFSGALRGLTRVRLFHQDDAHIFCRDDQVEQEILNVLNMIEEVYLRFNISFEMVISTRPAEYIGSIAVWDKAEKVLKDVCLNRFGSCVVDEGGGAFYGPKIDITIKDKQGRQHQCATVQLDFNLPERFSLSYINEQGQKEQPVMIHRAIFGSFERFIAVLLEHTQGSLPFWLSPRQIYIVPIGKEQHDYCVDLGKRLAKYEVYVDISDEHLKNKIKLAVERKYNYIFVVGKKEVESSSVNIRSRSTVIGSKPVDELLAFLKNTANN